MLHCRAVPHAGLVIRHQRATNGLASRQQDGGARLHARFPPDWRIGTQTGLGERGTIYDIGLFWPPQRQPVLLTVYLTEAPETLEQRSATIAAVARAVAEALVAIGSGVSRGVAVALVHGGTISRFEKMARRDA